MISGFRTNIIIRTLILSCTIFLLCWLLSKEAYIWTPIGLGALVIFQIFRLISYIEKTNRMLTVFFETIRSNDYNINLNDKRGPVFSKLASEMNLINNDIKRLKERNEEQYLYLKRVVEHVSVGLIAVENDSKIDFTNHAALVYLEMKEISSLKQLSSRYPLFRQIIENNHQQISPVNISQQVSLSVNSESLKLKNRNIKIISFKNIKKELDETEFVSWEKIIQVLAHEIMNSITPISTLSRTISLILKDIGTENQDLQDISKASTIIEKRCGGLMEFVRHYKDLISVPQIQKTRFTVQTLFDTVCNLLKPDINKKKIKIIRKIEQPPIFINADIKLIEQILINLFNNSFDALTGIANPEIELVAFHDLAGNIVIKIIDNGTGIEPQQMEKVFIPFFTTKPKGSGIGLSLAREIMRLHAGFINISSEKNKTTVMLLFNSD